MGSAWTVEVANEDFARFARSLHEYEQAILDVAVPASSADHLTLLAHTA